MKKIFSLLIAIVFLFSNCHKMLDTVPTDFLSPVNYYKTADHIKKALTGVYDPLGTVDMYGFRLCGQLAYSNDEGIRSAASELTGPAVYNHSISDPYINNLWTACYTGIDRANDLLANIHHADMDETLRAQYRGEALFLRAYYYYLLALHWGDVPLKLTPTIDVQSVDLERSPLRKVYEQIIADMTEAKDEVATISSLGFNGRISKTAVMGMLARVSLSMAGYPVRETSKYAAARDWADSVILSGEHALNPDYKQIFINHAQDIYDIKENLWEIEFFGNGLDAYNETSWIGVWFGIASNDLENPGYCYGALYATNKLFNLYEETDQRRDWNISTYKYSGTNKVPYNPTDLYNRFPGKWRREYELITPKQKNGGPINFPILRYSDILLMRAEAENEMNGPADAVAYLNQVRERAGATLFTEANNNAITNQQQFREVIRDERARELCFESLRNHDLKRWGIFVSTMKNLANTISLTYPTNLRYLALSGNNVSERHLLFPIPSREMALNKAMTQNPGW
jgi:SusD family.